MGCSQVVRQRILTPLFVGSSPPIPVYKSFGSVMSIKIEFIEGVEEKSSPIIKLTKSRNGKTGTATFVFINPTIFEISNNTNIIITNLTLKWEEKRISTNDLEVLFKNGKPFLIKAIFIFKNSKEWFDFLNLINFYSKEIGLSFSKKTF